VVVRSAIAAKNGEKSPLLMKKRGVTQIRKAVQPRRSKAEVFHPSRSSFEATRLKRSKV
jgi:hypothetical protein